MWICYYWFLHEFVFKTARYEKGGEIQLLNLFNYLNSSAIQIYFFPTFLPPGHIVHFYLKTCWSCTKLFLLTKIVIFPEVLPTLVQSANSRSSRWTYRSASAGWWWCWQQLVSIYCSYKRKISCQKQASAKRALKQ